MRASDCMSSRAAASLAGPVAVALTGTLINYSGYRVIFAVCAVCLMLGFGVLLLLREREAAGEVAMRMREIGLESTA